MDEIRFSYFKDEFRTNFSNLFVQRNIKIISQILKHNAMNGYIVGRGNVIRSIYSLDLTLEQLIIGLNWASILNLLGLHASTHLLKA